MTYVALLALAITSLAPHVTPREARSYARIIEQVADRREIAPTVLAAHVWVESRYRPRTRSVTNDYGLGQVHVAARGSAAFLGREELLYDPRENLRETARIAAMWRGYHRRECDESSHGYWSHMAWGYRVKNTRHADKVVAVAWLMVLHMELIRAVRSGGGEASTARMRAPES